MENELILPWPPSGLSPNARLHWRKKAPITKAYKNACWALAKEAGWGPIVVPVGQRLHLFVTFYPPDRRHRDDDNVFASFKAGRDGLALALDIDDRLFASHPFLHTEIGGMVKVKLTGEKNSQEKKMAELKDLIGQTMASVENLNDEELVFITNGGKKYKLSHWQDCCESVMIESIVGDLADLVGEPILLAEKSTSNENPKDAKPETVEYQESFTWTFYKFATRKGYVDVRWYGESNGYYSESVEFNAA